MVFFLEGVIDVSRSATETTQRIVRLIGRDRRRVLDELGRAAGSASRLHDLAVNEIVFTIPEAAARLNLSEVTIGKAAGHLEDLSAVHEATGRARNRLYVYSEYLGILQEGTEEEPG